MSTKYEEDLSPTATLKNESSRQRWDLFHRAIAHAKQSNDQALEDAESNSSDVPRTAPVLTIVR